MHPRKQQLLPESNTDNMSDSISLYPPSSPAPQASLHASRASSCFRFDADKPLFLAAIPRSIYAGDRASGILGVNHSGACSRRAFSAGGCRHPRLNGQLQRRISLRVMTGRYALPGYMASRKKVSPVALPPSTIRSLGAILFGTDKDTYMAARYVGCLAARAFSNNYLLRSALIIRSCLYVPHRVIRFLCALLAYWLGAAVISQGAFMHLEYT